MSRKLANAIGGTLLWTVILGVTVADATTKLPTPLMVDATVASVCVAGIGAPIAMTSPTATRGQTGSGTVVVTCTAGKTYDVMLDQGVNAASGVGPIQHKKKSVLGAATVTYGLYQDAAYSASLGRTVGPDALRKTGSGIVDIWPVYMKVDSTSATGAPTGASADVVRISVVY